MDDPTRNIIVQAFDEMFDAVRFEPLGESADCRVKVWIYDEISDHWYVERIVPPAEFCWMKIDTRVECVEFECLVSGEPLPP